MIAIKHPLFTVKLDHTTCVLSICNSWLTVLPAPFWPAMSVNGLPNSITACSSGPKERIPTNKCYTIVRSDANGQQTSNHQTLQIRHLELTTCLLAAN